MRDRLVDILLNTVAEKDENTCDYVEWLADELLSAGIIVPPCKVGQTVWFPSEYYDGPYPLIITRLEIYEEETILYSEGGGEWHPEDFGKTVFLTREEAEKALAEREKDVNT